MTKLRLTIQLKKKAPPIYVDRLNIENINNATGKDLYEKTDLKDQKQLKTFTADMEHVLDCSQKKIWGLIRRRKRIVNEYVTVTTIPKEAEINRFKQMYDEDEIPGKGNNGRRNYPYQPRISRKIYQGTENRKAAGTTN